MRSGSGVRSRSRFDRRADNYVDAGAGRGAYVQFSVHGVHTLLDAEQGEATAAVLVVEADTVVDVVEDDT